MTSHHLNESSNRVSSVWAFNSGDDEDEIAMWKNALVNIPARRPASIISDQEVEKYVKTSVSSALERARQRHSMRQEQRRASSSLSPKSHNNRKSLLMSPTSPSPKLERRVKVRQSMMASMPTLSDI